MHNLKSVNLNCTACESTNMFMAINLGVVPLANTLNDEATLNFEEAPLHLFICANCGLGQLDEKISANKLFKDYRYLSSMSSTFLTHAEEYVNNVIKKYNLNKNDWVLEIASNDGYLLKYFKDKGIECLGIEPADNVAKLSMSKDIDTICDFFSMALATKILAEKGFPKLIIANNVYAHVPDIQDFTKGLSLLTNESTIISIENPSIINILSKNQFDTVYHEHFSYLSVTSVNYLARKYGLQIFSTEEIDTHGGSIRYWLKKLDSLNDSNDIEKIIEDEHQIGLVNPDKWAEAQTELDYTLQIFKKWLKKNFELGNRVIGYGAAAKASTILNCANISIVELPMIVDSSHEKQNRYMPRANFPIVSIEKALEYHPTDIVIFPWNISEEITDYLNQIFPVTRIWSIIPQIRQVK